MRSKIKELIERTFDIWVQSLWLKEISKICEKIKKLDCERVSQRIVLDEMIKTYNEKYPNKPIETRENHES